MRHSDSDTPDQPDAPVVMHNIRVTHFSPGGLRGRGGMGRFLAYLIPAFQRRYPDIPCRVVDTYGPGPFALMPFWFAIAVVQLLWQALWKQTDLVHIHMAAFGSTARKLTLATLARHLRLPVILHLHGSELAKFIDGLAPYWRERVIRGLKLADGVVVIGHYWCDYVTGHLGVPPERVTIIFNGVPDPGWHRSVGVIDASPPAEPKPCQLLALGVLGPRKGTPEILAALASPCLSKLAWFATLAGNGPVAHYQAEVQRRGLEARVSLPGWVDQDRAWKLLSQSDILLLPSRWEGLPVAILEAMAAGVAVIATPVGGIPDAITQGETGWLVPPGDAVALSTAIVRLINDPVLRNQLIIAARQRFEGQFCINHTADQVAGIYRCLVPSGNKLR